MIVFTEKGNTQHTALLTASFNGQLSMVQWLLENGSSIKEIDCFGNTALLLASAKGYLPIVQYLLKMQSV